MSDLISTFHSVKTIGPVRLELLPDGQYLIHLPPPSMVDYTQTPGGEDGYVLALVAGESNDRSTSSDEAINL